MGRTWIGSGCFLVEFVRDRLCRVESTFSSLSNSAIGLPLDEERIRVITCLRQEGLRVLTPETLPFEREAYLKEIHAALSESVILLHGGIGLDVTLKATEVHVESRGWVRAQLRQYRIARCERRLVIQAIYEGCCVR